MYQPLIDSLLNDLGMVVEGLGISFYEIPHHGTAVMAARPFSTGEVIFFDRALCFVDPDLPDTPDPDSTARIKECLSHIPARNKQRLDHLCQLDILQTPPAYLLRLLKAMPLSIQFPILKDRLEDAKSKVITAQSPDSRHTTWCAPLLLWTDQLFPHSCVPNAFVVPSSRLMEN